MKTRIILLFVIGNIIFLHSCNTGTSQLSKTQKEYAYRIGRGYRDTILLDKTTPLDSLINRLEKPWEWVNTGAGYWIGYTDNMFFIASYKDKAIKPLVSLIIKTDSLRGKIGGLFTLHLIGINSKVVGRQKEEFKDTLAREAILSFIDDNDLHMYVISLLKRDPWKYDIPFLIKYLAIPNRDYSFVLSALRRYQTFYGCFPLWQPIPESLYDKELDMYLCKDGSNMKIAEMIALKNALHGRAWVDEKILCSKEWIKGLECSKNKTHPYLIHSTESDGSTKFVKPQVKFMETFLFHPVIDYSSFKDDKIIYAYKNDSLYFYSEEGARNFILKNWKSIIK